MSDELIKIENQIKELTNKWEGKPPSLFMSREYIDRRFDRTRYFRLKHRLNILRAAGAKTDDQVEMTEKIFNDKN